MDKIALSDHSLGYIYLLIAVIGWGMSTTLISFGLENFSALPFLAFRFLLALLVFTPFIVVKRLHLVVNLFQNRWVWIVGLSESMGLIFQYFGQETVSAGLSALLSLLFLVIVPFISPFIVYEKIRSYHAYGIILGLIGVIFITSEGNIENFFNGSIIGAILLLLAAFSYAIYIVSTSRVSTIEIRDIDVFSLFYVVMAIITFVSLFFAGITGTLVFPPTDAWIWIIPLTIFSTLIAFLAYFKALKTVSANTASILLILQVIIPFSIDVLFLEITYSLWIYYGSLIIVFAIIIVLVKSSQTSKKTLGD
ncbi:MAG: hypothetical protein HeimC3_09260 [Candidatus Heimdallarchaeota archaeon LC_3]|nr:MAG: hypothetical protein HeimC3_09260 [Candidatus Heimdallarchaeota archaeon LC_3]